MNIYVGNLPRNTNEDAVRNLFAAYGTVEKVNLINDRETGELRGFGFVEMPSDSEAAEAIDHIHGSDLGGRTLNVNQAKPRGERSFSNQRSSFRRF
ncbi:MAG: RNA-binding protein [Calditrichaceae bacterium]|nr:RNA-binding protein [Calditrichaceae bacterium]MBN2710701.1 RNA-binding protein [Calditrichaceae bacterium]RQV92730.1 MAG: RNA-binding protein [Calditrichota bacterium]